MMLFYVLHTKYLNIFLFYGYFKYLIYQNPPFWKSPASVQPPPILTAYSHRTILPFCHVILPSHSWSRMAVSQEEFTPKLHMQFCSRILSARQRQSIDFMFLFESREQAWRYVHCSSPYRYMSLAMSIYSPTNAHLVNCVAFLAYRDHSRDYEVGGPLHATGYANGHTL
jgi:hypothetical protein